MTAKAMAQDEDQQLEIGHILFLDIVDYSKLLSDKQREVFHRLTELVRGTAQFRAAEEAGKLVRLPTGDGMALAFFTSTDAPVKCAQEISRRLHEWPELQLRMGIHSGPVDEVVDVNDRRNVTGAGINLAQRVMDCGDAGHILLSKRVADDLQNYSRWQPYLYDLGEAEVKHGVRVHVVNLFGDDFGNSALPTKLRDIPRPPSTSAKPNRIGWLRAAFLGLVVIAGTSAWFLSRIPKHNAVNVLDRSIAVLPLENLTAEKENAFFADGIQDELLSDLAKIKDLKVISRTSVMQYKAGITRNLKEIAQQLGVTNVVEGSVRREKNHIRVSVQLIDALTDRHIWAQRYDRTLADSLALQGELATEIAAGVGATLSPQEKARVQATPTKNTAAYDAYLRGRALVAGLTTDFSNVESAARSFREAVTLDPSFALAWAYLSSAESCVYWDGVDPTAARLAAAKAALDHAIALDPDLAENHLALGYYRYYGLRDFKGALAEFQTAEQGLPNNVDVLKAIGLIQRRFGHWDEAIAALRRVIELDPRNIQSAGLLATTYMTKRRFSDALAVSDQILTVDPSNTQGLGIKMHCLLALGKAEAGDSLLTNPGATLQLRAFQALATHRFAEAADLFSKALKDARDYEKGDILVDLGLAQKRAGNVAASKAAYEEAVQEFTQALSKVDKDAPPPAEFHSNLGAAYAGLGDATLAVSEGRKGMALQPTSEDPFEGPQREEDMAVIYAWLGDADNAIPILKRWAHVPSSNTITPALMRIDPTWDPIRNDPRFQKLVTEKKL